MFEKDHVHIIAEVGSNHDGSLESALAHVDAAAEAGADFVKFQGFLADEMVAPDHDSYAMLKRLEMPRDWYPQLMKQCQKRGVRFLSTATNFTTLGWMEEFGAWGYKVASCNITYQPMIDRLVEIGKPVIFSAGLATLEEIKGLASSLEAKGFTDFAVLHCIAQYPAPAAALNLRAIPILTAELSCPVGYSDHSLGNEAAIAAVALGARIIEKHFSLTGSGFSPDHDVASQPDEFAAMCEAVRNTEVAVGTEMEPDPKAIFSMRRSLHFVQSLKAGEVVSADDLKVIRPEDGLLPGEIARVVGCHLVKDVEAGAPVNWEILERSGKE